MRVACALVVVCAGVVWAQEAARGPLRVAAGNPHWFVDDTGKAVVVAGTHTWASLQDNGLILEGATQNPPAEFNWTGYLELLGRWGHNFIRLWRWETAKWADRFTGGEVKYCRPHPWLRTGPGVAADGEPKFDLTRYDAAYFERLRGRVKQAGERGIYVSVMLFEGWQMQFSDGWKGHPFHAANNVNGIEGDLNGDGFGLEYVALEAGEGGRRMLELQRDYVRRVVTAVNDLDNVLFEIANEAGAGSKAWQYDMIRYVKSVEATLPKQHPVGMTFAYKGGTNAELNASEADWISPNPGSEKENYRENPCAGCSPKVVLNDTDHLWGHTGGDAIWVWKSFTRGLNPLLMEDLTPSPVWQDSARMAMGQVVRYGRRVKLAAMRPAAGLAATGYCLAAPGEEYLVFQHNKGQFTVDLKGAAGRFKAEWLDVARDRVVEEKTVDGGAVRTFTTPFPGPAVLWLGRE